MKYIKGLLLFAMLFSLWSCLPDSPTKWEEDPPIIEPAAAPAPPSAFSYPHMDQVILTLEMVSGDIEDEFSSGGYIVNADGDQGSINAVDSANSKLLVTRTSGYFAIGDEVDYSGGSLIQASASITNIQNVAASASSNITISPSSSNLGTGVSFAIASTTASSLPSGVSISSTTGVITITAGTVIAEDTYVITATNSAGSYSTEYSFAAAEAPSGLAYTQNAILTVTSSSLFKVGDFISTPIPTGEGAVTFGAKGLVLQVPDSTHLIIRVLHGSFAKDDNIDNVYPYDSVRTVISEVRHFSDIFTVADASVYQAKDITSSIEGDVINQGNAYGEVVFTETTTDALFVRNYNPYASAQWGTSTYSSQGGYYIDTSFVDDGGVTNFSVSTRDTAVAAPAAEPILIMASNEMIAASADFATSAFAAGEEMTDANGFNSLIHKVDTSGATDYISLEVSNLAFDISTPTSALADNDTVDNVNPYNFDAAGSTATLTAVYTSPVFYAYRGDETTITASLRNDTTAFYSIDPELPEGLIFDGTTGKISGTPTEPSELTVYKITATNSAGNTSSVIVLKVLDQLKLEDSTEGAPSYRLHKSGQSNKATDCRLTDYQIASAEAAGTYWETMCLLDGQELDIYSQGLKLNFHVGAGICEYVRWRPYFHYQYPYYKTTTANFADNVNPTTIYRITVDCPVADAANDGLDGYFDGSNYATATRLQRNATNITSTDKLCQGDHSYDDSEYPNCDNGSYRIVNLDYIDKDTNADDIPDACQADLTAEAQTVECGGERGNCINGAMTDMISQWDGTVVGLILDAADGISSEDATYTAEAPMNKSYLSNMFIANYTQSNDCSMDTNATYDQTQTTYRYDVDGWETFSAAQSADTGDAATTDPSPFRGSRPFYTLYCLDAAEEVLGVIRMSVREWDRAFNLTNNIDRLIPGGATEDFPIGTRAGYMDHDGSAAGDIYNDKDDWDDDYNGGAGVPANMTDCGTGGTEHEYPEGNY